MNRQQTAPMPISPEQCRAARHVLKMTVLDVCDASDLAKNTVVKLEAGGEVRASVAERLRAVFEARGISFAPNGRGVSW